jgi:hypothetical protein
MGVTDPRVNCAVKTKRVCGGRFRHKPPALAPSRPSGKVGRPVRERERLFGLADRHHDRQAISADPDKPDEKRLYAEKDRKREGGGSLLLSPCARSGLSGNEAARAWRRPAMPRKLQHGTRGAFRDDHLGRLRGGGGGRAVIFLLILIVPFVVWLFIHAAASSRMNSAADGWNRMGEVRGRTLDEVVGFVGPATSISQIADGQLYQWIHTSSVGGFHIAMLFKDGICLGITHQSRS